VPKVGDGYNPAAWMLESQVLKWSKMYVLHSRRTREIVETLSKLKNRNHGFEHEKDSTIRQLRS
jgi:hypothetical protein